MYLFMLQIDGYSHAPLFAVSVVHANPNKASVILKFGLSNKFWYITTALDFFMNIRLGRRRDRTPFDQKLIIIFNTYENANIKKTSFR